MKPSPTRSPHHQVLLPAARYSWVQRSRSACNVECNGHAPFTIRRTATGRPPASSNSDCSPSLTCSKSSSIVSLADTSISQRAQRITSRSRCSTDAISPLSTLTKVQPFGPTSRICRPWIFPGNTIHGS